MCVLAVVFISWEAGQEALKKEVRMFVDMSLVQGSYLRV